MTAGLFFGGVEIFKVYGAIYREASVYFFTKKKNWANDFGEPICLRELFFSGFVPAIFVFSLISHVNFFSMI